MMSWKSVEFSDKSNQNHEHPKIIMEKTTQARKRCCYLHQTDFPSRIPRSQKPRNSKGFCEDDLPPQMAEQNSHGRGMGDTASSSTPRPSRAVMRFLFACNYQLSFTHNKAKEIAISLNTNVPKDGHPILLFFERYYWIL